MGLFDFLKIIGMVFHAIGIFILSFFSFLIILNFLPGTMLTDPDTGEQTMRAVPTLICIIGPFISTYILVRRRNPPKPRRLKAGRKTLPTSKEDVTACNTVPDVDMRTDEELLVEAREAILDYGCGSVSLLQRKLQIGYGRAARLIDKLEEQGFIGPFEGSAPRKILVSHEGDGKKGLSLVDEMEGHEFEYWCADLLKQNGFEKVEVTPGSGDQGVDVLAEKGGVKYAIQCKCYSKDLGNTPIQEVEAGRIYYGCHVGVVMTNRYFTSGARDLAQKTGALLWDRDFIENALKT